MPVLGPIEHGKAVPNPPAVGVREGSSVGSAVGSCDGGKVGIADGEPVLGERLDGLMVVGTNVGAKVGNAVGAREGSSVGEKVGVLVDGVLEPPPQGPAVP